MLTPLTKTRLSLEVMLATGRNLYPTDKAARCDFYEGWLDARCPSCAVVLRERP